MDTTCPRCHHQIPNDRFPGKYQGALSRTDGETMVCAACGNDEGVKQRAGELETQLDWPVTVDQAWYDLSMGVLATPPPLGGRVD